MKGGEILGKKRASYIVVQTTRLGRIEDKRKRSSIAERERERERERE